MRRAIRFVIAGLLVLGVAADGALLAGILITREPALRPLTPDRIDTASRPAVVLVQSNYTVTTSLPTFTIPQSKIKSVLVPQLQQLVNQGKLNPYDNAAVQRAAVNFILANPDAYYVPGPRATDQFGIVSTGSGFFVTQDGYLVTAAHVVSASKADILAEVLTVSKDASNVAQLRQDLADSLARDTGLTITEAQLDTMVGFVERWLDAYLSVDNVAVQYYLGSGTVETGDRLTGTGARASVVSLDPYGTGHDVAILKANVTGVSTLQLADGSPRIGEATYPLGYPRVGYLDEAAPLDQTIGTTMTAGKIDTTQAQKTGWTAWGTDASITHGNSGGPVLGPDGKVLGIVSFGEVDKQGNLIPGQGYFVPSEYIRAALAADSIHVTNDPKSLTSTYYHALAEGDIQHYRTELGLLQSIQASTSFNGYIKDDVVTTEGKILAGNDKTPPDLTVYVVPAGAASGGLILAVLVTWAVLAITARRRKPMPAAVAADSEEAPQSELPAAVGPAYVEPAVDMVASPHDVLRESAPVTPVPSALEGGEEAPAAPAGES